jgi:hypothetical protein
VCSAEPDALSYYMQTPQRITSQTSYSFESYSSILGSVPGPGSVFLFTHPSKDGILCLNAICILNRSRK